MIALGPTASRLAWAGVIATWLLPTTVVAQHGKEEPASHAAASTKASAEHAAATAKHEAEEEPAKKSSAKSAAKEPTKTAEHGSAKTETKHSVIPELDEVPSRIDVRSKKGTAATKESEHSENGRSPAASEHASSSKDRAAASAAGTRGASAASTHGKAAPKSELQAALARIDEQMAASRASTPASRAPEIRVTSETRVRVTPTPAPVPARMHLNWRTTLVWSEDLDDVDATRRDAPRVGLVWTPAEPLPSTPIRPTATPTATR